MLLGQNITIYAPLYTLNSLMAVCRQQIVGVVFIWQVCLIDKLSPNPLLCTNTKLRSPIKSLIVSTDCYSIASSTSNVVIQANLDQVVKENLQAIIEV